jgi:hypothetical protein
VAGQQLLTHAYQALIPGQTAATALDQSFTFFNESGNSYFDLVSFAISRSTGKWSINTTRITGLDSGSAVSLTLRYTIWASIPVDDLGAAAWGNVIRMPNSPVPLMTTFLIPFVTLSSPAPLEQNRLAAAVAVFDFALADGQRVDISHDIQITDGGECLLLLTFPAFNHSLFYDPTLGLSLLTRETTTTTEASSSSGGGGGIGLILAGAVGAPAGLLAVAAICVGAYFAWGQYKKKKHMASTKNTPGMDMDANIEAAMYIGAMHRTQSPILNESQDVYLHPML